MSDANKRKRKQLDSGQVNNAKKKTKVESRKNTSLIVILQSHFPTVLCQIIEAYTKNVPLWEIITDPLYYEVDYPSGRDHKAQWDTWEKYIEDSPWDCNCGTGTIILYWIWGRHDPLNCWHEDEECVIHNTLQIITFQWTTSVVQHLIKVTEQDEDSIRQHIRDFGTRNIMNI